MQVQLSGEDPAHLKAGLTALVRDGIFSQALGVLTGGALLTGCALSLGASSLFVGWLAAIPCFAQIAQIPAVVLVERVRRRKAICVLVTLAARLLLLPLIIVPLISNHGAALAVLMACFVIVTPLSAVGGCAWMSWTCDLVPAKRLGEVFSRRQFRANISGIVAGLLGAVLVEGGDRLWPRNPPAGYVAVFIVGIAAAMASTWYLTRMPEMPMPPRPQVGVRALFAKPVADRNFRRLMIFLGGWNLAVNLALPFFVIYLVDGLGYSVTAAIVLATLSQVVYIAALPSWGRLSDRCSNKTVISLCGPLVLLCLLGWVAAAQPVPGAHTLPLLAAVQLVLGLATSGLDLACNNITFKVAPRGEATVYLGANGLLKSVCAGIAPVAGGMLIHALPQGQAHALFRWTSAAGGLRLLEIDPWHALFLVAALFGALALLPLRRMKEAGEVGVPAVAGFYLERLRARFGRSGGRYGAPLARPTGAAVKYLPSPASASAAGLPRGASPPLLPEAAAD